MWGKVDTVRTLLEYGANVGATDNVRNQMMIIMTIVLVLTIMMMMTMTLLMIQIGVILDNDDERSMYW